MGSFRPGERPGPVSTDRPGSAPGGVWEDGGVTGKTEATLGCVGGGAADEAEVTVSGAPMTSVPCWEGRAQGFGEQERREKW